ncbi:hypothetical protein BDZ91DRAFT_850747 [Kalaharituber pfeilii]|nr:hypothetical protein BDZ91DRAFT_850747 [Kalaharituber pfeilii]
MSNYHSHTAPSFKILPSASTPLNEPPQPTWTNTPQANLALGSCAPPESISSYTPILSITISRPGPHHSQTLLCRIPDPTSLAPCLGQTAHPSGSRYVSAQLFPQGVAKRAGAPGSWRAGARAVRVHVHEARVPVAGREFNPHKWVWRKRKQQPNGKGTVMQGKEVATGSGVRQRVKAWRKERREVEGFGKGKVMEWNRIAVSNFTAMRLERGRRPEGFREWGDMEKNWKRTAENGEEWDELERFFSGIRF